jgi:hypothetical protein
MSNDHDQHGHHDPGGHELEAINTKLLFRLMISLSLVTLLASAAVVQWYYSQRAELQERNAIEGSFMLIQYKEKMAKDIEGIDVVRRQILADSKVLLAPAPPADWVHPDDLLSGGGAPAVNPAVRSEPEPAPMLPPGIVVEGAPAIPVPAGGEAKPEGEPKPEGADKPAGPEGTDKPEDKSDFEKPADKAEKPADKAEKPADKPGNE